MTENTEHAKKQAKAQIKSIVEMVTALQEAEENDDEAAREVAYETIMENPLSVEVREWHSPGADDYRGKPTDYRVLLCTGGPACQIVGGLNRWGEPETATAQYQDWFTPWINYNGTTQEEEDALLRYTQCFWYGE